MLVQPARECGTIVVVEDDRAIAQTMTDALDSSGYHVAVAETGAAATQLVERLRPDLVLLDLMLPDIDGLILCSRLKAAGDTPIVICSASMQKRDAILGLKLGADDYIPKPFDIDELEARLEAILRRARRTHPPVPVPVPAPAPDIMRVGQLRIDHAKHAATVGGEVLALTPSEYRLLSAFASRPDEILSRAELARTLWDHPHAGTHVSIDVHVRRLRAKLNGTRIRGLRLVAAPGVGYMLVSGERPRHARPSTVAARLWRERTLV